MLVRRAEARQRHDWRIVSHLLAGIANGPLKSRHGRLFTADDFDRSARRRVDRPSIPLDKRGLKSFGRMLFGFR